VLADEEPEVVDDVAARQLDTPTACLVEEKPSAPFSSHLGIDTARVRTEVRTPKTRLRGNPSYDESAAMRLAIIVYDGVDEMDALGPLEVFRNARGAGAELDARLVSLDGKATVTGAHSLRFLPDGVYEPGAPVVVVPGGGWNTRAASGAWAEVQRGVWLPILKAAADRGALMASICTGAMLLAHAQVIGNRRATTHHDAWSELEATGATLAKDRVVDDGNLVTSGGVTSGLDLAFWLVERLSTSEIAETVANEMECTRFRPDQT
jgi:transcriptional regulator GlxA family with amidase domain